MRSRSLFSLLPFLLIPLSIPQAQVTAIRAGTLIDPVSGTARTDTR
jgi:hypothetical protein